MTHFFVNRAIGIYMRWNQLMLRWPLLRAARQVERTQSALLRDILRENMETEFGRNHSFDTIANFDDYRANVPVQSYDQLEPYISSQQNGVLALTAKLPTYYARTSGTTGRSKDIPLTDRGLRQVKRAQQHLALSLWRDTRFFSGSVMGLASPVEEGRLKNGEVYGSTSGSTYRSLSPILARKFLLPYEAFSIKDMEAKYQVYALVALGADDVTGIVTANPSSIVKIMDMIHDGTRGLLNALLTGDDKAILPEAREFLPQIRQRSSAEKVRKLVATEEARGALAATDIWPKLAAIGTWTGGSCGIALGRLGALLPSGVKIVEYGYGASEFMGTANVDAITNTCLPLVSDHVYEFVRRQDWEAGKLNFLGLHQIESGQDYYIFVTTWSGLYRYNINDIVRAEPGIGACPALHFLQKGRGVTSITGEKLSEDQLIAAIDDVLSTAGHNPDSYIALADEDASRYLLYLEFCNPPQGNFEPDIDLALRAGNSEYDDKRASGRLRPIKLIYLQPGAGDTIKKWSLKRGVREAQYKPTLLDYARNWKDKLTPLVLGDEK